MSLAIVPIDMEEANAFVRAHHRHHDPVRGCKFCVGVAHGGVPLAGWPEAGIVGVAVVGRPVSRHLDDGWSLEVVRCCTDGTRNAASMLYRACWRAARELGYRKLITYTLPEEGGASLRGAGFRLIGERGGGSWSRPSRPRVDTHPMQSKLLWECA